MSKRMKLLLLAVVVVFGGLIGTKLFVNRSMNAYFDNMPVAPAVVSATFASADTWISELTAVGSVAAVQGAELTTEVAGIVKEPVWVSRVKRFGSVEAGLVGGLLLFLAGMFWSVNLFNEWRHAGYNELQPQAMMRSVIPAVTMLVVGLQAAAGALLAGALQLAWKTSGKK